jgi:hypothetical protein
MAVFMSSLDGMIVLIALPAIFNGIHLDPLAPANIGYLLWMIMGYRLVQAVFVVNLGRLGDILGRVRIYNLGFVVFTVASILLSLDPFTGSHAALWLIGWRFLRSVPRRTGPGLRRLRGPRRDRRDRLPHARQQHAGRRDRGCRDPGRRGPVLNPSIPEIPKEHNPCR